MGKDTYLVFDFEDGPENPSGGDWKSRYDPAHWEEVKIEFNVPPLEKPVEKKPAGQAEKQRTWPETDRRRGSERRAGTDRRVGSEDRRSWQESRWIGASDCRSGQTDRRQGPDRRVNPGRRRR